MAQSERRFERPLGYPESPEDYGPGGYCPVVLGQIFRNRYRVLRKLGWGSQSTVWLAKDGNYVALKVSMATCQRTEVDLLERLTDNVNQSRSPGHTQVILDAFEPQSLNGKHQILVLEPLGRTLGEFSERVASHSSFDDIARVSFVKHISRQLVLGLNHIHSCGIVHRDLQPGNVSFALGPEFNLVSEDVVQQSKVKRDDMLKVRRLDGRALDDTVPAYVVEPWPLNDGVTLGTSLEQIRIVIIDFEAASTFEDINVGKHAFPVAMRPPELVLDIPMLARQADIWALGCLLFETVAFRSLFHVDTLDCSSEEQDNDYLLSITEVLGLLPPSFLSNWVNRSDVVDDVGNILPDVAAQYDSNTLQELVMKFKPQDMDEPEAALFLDFLRCMLQLEPTARVSTDELLQHPWLRG